MNIAIFASAFYPHVGGVEELVRQLAHTYHQQGMTAIVLTNRWPRSLPAYEDYEGIPTYRLAMRVPEGSAKARLNYSFTRSAIQREMLNILQRHHIELLHVQCVSSNGYYALLAKQALGLPLVVTTQGERTMDAAQIYQRSAFMNQMLHELLKAADYVTACSKNTLEDMEQYWGQSLAGRSCVVYNGIQVADFAIRTAYTHPKSYILGIGRLVPQKGFDLLIQAFAKAPLPDYDLLLAGEGPERSDLEQLVHYLKIEDRVHFVGRADRVKAVALFKGCAFFVLPSRQEPQGIVNLEAMAAGKAVVAARVGGVPEIVIDNETGLLVPAEDVDAFSDAIGRLATDRDLRLRLGSAGRQRAQSFDWLAIADQYINIYSTMMSNG